MLPYIDYIGSNFYFDLLSHKQEHFNLKKIEFQKFELYKEQKTKHILYVIKIYFYETVHLTKYFTDNSGQVSQVPN